MIKENLNGLIKNAMIEKNKVRLETLRSVKTAFMNWETVISFLELIQKSLVKLF